jgi:hypothetical protein
MEKLEPNLKRSTKQHIETAHNKRTQTEHPTGTYQFHTQIQLCIRGAVVTTQHKKQNPSTLKSQTLILLAFQPLNKKAIDTTAIVLY